MELKRIKEKFKHEFDTEKEELKKAKDLLQNELINRNILVEVLSKQIERYETEIKAKGDTVLSLVYL